MRVLTVGLDLGTLKPLAEVTGELVPASPASVRDEVQRGGWDAAVVRATSQEALDAAQLASRSGVPVLCVDPPQDPRALRDLVRAGVADVLWQPTVHELAQALQALVERRGTEQKTQLRRGSVIAVTGAQGGTGRSTVTLNLALLLSESGDTIAVDMVPWHGVLHILADLDAPATVADVLATRPTRESVLRAAERYEGIRVLAGAPSPDSFRADAQAVEELVAAVAASADYAVLDLGTVTSPHLLPALEQASLVVCLTRMTVPGLRNLKAYLQHLVHQHVPVQKVLAVGVMDRGWTSPRTAEEIAGLEIPLTLPFDSAAAAAENQGVPVVLGAPRSRLSRALGALRDEVLSRLEAPQREVSSAAVGA